ncbi:response regulator [Cronbergia sp. UHCC 0137]|uniref:response regulator n=1 Tax=Cronbergia sp. UHCC 0137 TaxID=3110239 RepID=UPI002B20D37E|nr:response regulator [Cronbergia sp. UHCC 0137]MEA5620363.1 response regulator [Cronbergia sp. UHCC 0137]
MNNLKNNSENQILNELKLCTQIQYNGQLVIKSSTGVKWILYYRLGQIVWATGGTHPGRRWRRNIMQNCPQTDLSNIQINLNESSQIYWDYQLLKFCCENQTIQRNQVNAIVINTIAEILFDIAQQINHSSLTYDRNQQVILEPLINSTSANILLEQMQESWNNWLKSGLSSISPHLAPVLQNPQQLRQQVNPTIYQNFQRLIDGQNTLWDLAIKMKQDVSSITRSLIPYIRKGIMKLVELPDLPLSFTKSNDIDTSIHRLKIPLVACIDDSPQVCQILEQIFTSRGMKFIGINDPLQAIPTLISNPPDLIFLDLLMPVVNGYEVCSQLRRTSVLVNTPVVILTGSDGAFDKVRAKVFGATEFINKPINPDQVTAMVDKYLYPKPTVVNLCDFAFSY